MDSTASSARPASQRSGRSSRSRHSAPSSPATEQTPLLVRDDRSDDGYETVDTASVAESHKSSFWRRRWPSILALFILCAVIVFILLGFLATEGVEEYAMQAAGFKPTKLALSSLTKNGVQVEVQGDFRMDASKVKKSSVRNLGRFGTWIAKEIESGPTDVEVYLPEYGNVLLGVAKIPGIKVNIRNGHTTHVSFLGEIEAGSLGGIRNVANDWIEGRLGQVRVKGRAHVPLKSGLLHLGTQTIEQTMAVQGGDLPSLPAYNITKINVREARGGHKGMGADVSVVVTNDFPVQLTVPPVAVDLLVDGCQPSDRLIMVGTAETRQLEVQPNMDLHVNVTGHVEELPDSLTKQCPNSAKSPLDSLLGDYIHGNDATVYVNCCNFPDPTTPSWAKDLLKDITVPVPFVGHNMGNTIKNFSMTDVHFSFPDESAEPGTPESNPQISALVKVFINLPEEMNFPLGVEHIKATADVFYRKKKLGVLDLRKWQQATSQRIDAHDDQGPLLLVEADIKKAPLEVTDGGVLLEIIPKLYMGDTVMLDLKALVSVEVDTPMGQFAVREIPAEGVVPVKLGGHGKGRKGSPGIGSLAPSVSNLSIVDTSPTSMTLQALVNFTNPTNYSATVPYFNINLLVNGTTIGQGIVRDLLVHPGNNTNRVVQAVWDPFTFGGEEGQSIGREWLSQYVSGFNTSLTIQMHNNTIPAQPALSWALSHFPYTFPTPRMSGPKDPNEDNPDNGKKKGHFIQSATMHIISSTAIFTLASPFQATTLYITHMNATAYHEGHPSGRIVYDLPFAVPPGLSVTPRLPVEWSLGSIGFDAIKKALGGELKLSALAEVGIRIGHWREQIWYKGQSIGAKIRP